MKKLFAAFILIVTWSVAQAEGPANAVRRLERHDFVVSGVLRKSSADFVIKLAQSIEKARSPEEAIGLFSRKAMHDYPDYSVMDTVVTPLPQVTCGAAI